MPRKNATKPARPRLPRFSPTRIGLYLFCPRAYYLYYHKGLRWGGGTAGYALGGSLHRTLQSFHDRGGAAQVPLQELVAQLRERWSGSGFCSEEEERAHLAVGEAVLEQYHRTPPEAGRQTLWTEKMLQHRYPEFVLFGKIDRLDRRPDGSLEVVDYKSGRLSVTEAEVRDDLALTVYQLLVARQNPGIPVYTGILCLRTGQSASVTRTEAELDQVETEITGTVRRILQDERMVAEPGFQCRECVYPRVCPPGRHWLQDHPTR